MKQRKKERMEELRPMKLAKKAEKEKRRKEKEDEDEELAMSDKDDEIARMDAKKQRKQKSEDLQSIESAQQKQLMALMEDLDEIDQDIGVEMAEMAEMKIQKDDDIMIEVEDDETIQLKEDIHKKQAGDEKKEESEDEEDEKDEEEEEEEKEEEKEEEMAESMELEHKLEKDSRIKNAINNIKKKIAEWKAARKLIDNVFADLENMFYLLAQLLLMIELTSLTKYKQDKSIKQANPNGGVGKIESDYTTTEKCKIALMNLFKILVTPFTYFLVIMVAVFVILPSCFFLLIVRMNKVEVTSHAVAVREKQIMKETKCQRFMRVLNQLMRSSFMFIFLVIYPIIIIYIIIPYGGTDNDSVVIWSISSYLFIILLLQMFGTWRGVKSFEERKKLKPNQERYAPQTFKWNLGSILAILLLFYEVFQLSIFAYQTTTDNGRIEESDNTETSFSSESLTFIDSQKILKFSNFIIRICYLSLDFLDDNILEYYVFFSIFFVGLLILFFIYRFIYELRIYGRLKWKEENTEEAREIYFHSFIGTIIYGHGKLQNVNKWNAKIISLLADSFFLGICQKVILILSCDENQFLRIDPNRKCWESDHSLYSCIALILLGYYIPICAMIAPMFQEDIEIEEDKEKDEELKEKKKRCCLCCCKKKEEKEKESSAFKQFVSFTNTIAYVAPYMAAFTVCECFMLISSQFVAKGGEYGTIISQSIAMIGLLWFTINWTFNDLNKYGLTQNEPVFPFGVSIIKVLAFFCGFVGCLLEILRFNKIIDVILELFLLFLLIIIIAIIFGIIFLKYHSFFNSLDDNLDLSLMIKFNKLDKTLKLIDHKTKQLKLKQNEDKSRNKEEIIIPWTTDKKQQENIKKQFLERNTTNKTTSYNSIIEEPNH